MVMHMKSVEKDEQIDEYTHILHELISPFVEVLFHLVRVNTVFGPFVC